MVPAEPARVALAGTPRHLSALWPRCFARRCCALGGTQASALSPDLRSGLGLVEVDSAATMMSTQDVITVSTGRGVVTVSA